MHDTTQLMEMARKVSTVNSQIQPTLSSQEKPLTDYEIEAGVYVFDRLHKIYLTKFSRSFKDEAHIIDVRNEWSPQFGALSMDKIKSGMGMVKKNCVKGKTGFDWPDIPKVLAVCAGMTEDQKVEGKRLDAIKEVSDRTVARERWLTDTSARDAAKKGRDKAMASLKSILN